MFSSDAFFAPSEGLWQGRRVLITGHTGFKGGWLTLMLHRAGAMVSGLALPPRTAPSFFEAARVGDVLASSHTGDIRDRDQVSAVFEATQPEVVFHLAAQALVRESYSDPTATWSTNVMGTAHVLDSACRTAPVRVIVNVTSDKCYENREVVWAYRETDPLGGSDPYSASKGAAELVAQSWRRSFAGGRGLVSVRAGNVIGGGDWSADRLVPDCIRAFQRGQAVALRNPGSLRPWQHVLDPLSGYVRVAEQVLAKGSCPPALNFGPAVEEVHTVSEVVDALARSWGGDAGWVRDGEPSPHEANLLMLDATLARHTLGWRPRLSFREAIRWTASWYRAHGDGADMREYSLHQIESYLARDAA